VRYLYEIFVNGTGYGVVKIRIVARGVGVAWITLPSKGQYEYSVVRGRVEWGRENRTYSVFYDDVYFSFSSRDVSVVTIEYPFPYASLIIGSKAWFLSPMIRVPEGSPCVVRVVLEDVRDVIETAPAPYEQNASGFYFDLTRVGDSEITRVLIIYRIRTPVPTVVVRGAASGVVISVKVPVIYKSNFARRVIEMYGEAMPYLLKLFRSVKVEEVKVEFYLPGRTITTLGYVTTEDISKYIERGTVYLNLALTRFMRGYAEHTMVHELVHILLGKLGVPATNNLRWFHEGMADYVAYKICLELGYGNVTDIRDRYLAAVEEFRRRYGERYGVVQNWAARTIYGTGTFYAISFYVIYSLGEEYGGLEYYAKVLDRLAQHRRVTGIEQVVDALSYGAGEDLVGRFDKWGFVIATSPRRAPYLWLVHFTLIALALVAVWSLFATATRARRRVVIPSSLYRVCPHCKAALLPGVRRCPYCGAPLV